jgi:hypothetical protein
LYAYAAELDASSRDNQSDFEKIRSNVLGFGRFLCLYFGDKGFRVRNNVHLGAACTCGLALIAAAGSVWLLAGTWFSSRVIAPFVAAEIILWLFLRWRYERIHLKHMAKARNSAASEIRRLASKKLRLSTEALVRPTGHADMRRTALSAVRAIRFAWINMSGQARLRP